MFSSHDVSLIERLNVQSTIYVRESSILSLRPETRSYDVELIEEGTLPESLKADVLGSRSRILFVEGTERLRDAALYAHIYPGQKVISKGGSEAVIEAVRGLSSAGAHHWLQIRGLIDKDGRTPSEVERLALHGILTLPTPTIENLFFLLEVQQCFVNADSQMQGGLAWEARQQALGHAVSTVSAICRDDIIARRVCWAAQRAISPHPLSVKHVKNGSAGDLTVSLEPIKQAVTAEVNEILKNDIQHLLLRLPIKNTDLTDAAARALGASSFKAYCAVIQRQIDVETEDGVRAREALKKLLPHPPSLADNAVPQAQVVAHRYIGTIPSPQSVQPGFALGGR